jgi:hypothetical protein
MVAECVKSASDIQLPVSDETFTLSANLATPHASVGNC